MSEKPLILPQDDYNAALVANVHPPDWRNPAPRGRYNLVVIGAGTAGLVTAAGAAGVGARVALIERHLMGGDCLNVGCVPSKCIIRSSRVIGDLRAAAELGVGVPADVEVDFAAVMERMRRLRARISKADAATTFRDQKGVDVFLGDGRFAGPDTVEVGGTTLRFKNAVIATGARAAQVPIEGLAAAGYLTNETLFELTARPRRLAVIGAGPIGCEMAQAFQRLGTEVTLLDMSEHILAREDADAAEVVQRAFLRDGVRLALGRQIVSVRVEGSEKVITATRQGVEEEIRADEILLGVGRAPNIEGLNLEAVGVKYNRAGVVVDDGLRTANPRIFAAGDVCMEYKFTHTADAAARIVIQNALFFGRKRLSALHVPWCTYTDPEIAHVGMYEHQAAQKGVEVDTFTRPFAEVDRAIAEGEEEGFAKVIVKKGTDQILGATIVARHAGEMISEITLAMVGKIGLGTIATVIHPYPTQAEAIRQLGDAYNRTRLTATVKTLFERFLAWTRNEPSRNSSSSRGKAIGLAAGAAVLLAAASYLDLQSSLRSALAWIADLGPLGPVIFVAIYVTATVLFLPGSILTLGAGVIFGVVRGSVIVSISATLGATCAFLVGRYFAREWVGEKIAGNEKFRAIDEAVAVEGWKIVGLTRLSPVFPFNLLNYAFGVTKVSLRDYFFASWIGMIPGTIMYVYIGSLAGDLATLGAGGRERTPGEWGLYLVGLLATITVTIYVTRLARRALEQRVS
jgi:pyruvate/2-oxoglutarate dehydrogenase complex dihydrolipoamide dehydrogenase (E3) component/uncharacterized membrane protein YdjX (TVP38/TMEM64 family)